MQVPKDMSLRAQTINKKLKQDVQIQDADVMQDSLCYIRHS